MKVLTISQENFKKGLQLLEDDSRADFGSARKMLNVIITDRGGIAPRPGTSIVGEYVESNDTLTGLYNFKKSKNNPDILMKAFANEMDFLHPSLEEWATLKTGFTDKSDVIGFDDKDNQFGFSYSLVNTDNDDFTYFCNRFEEYMRWRGAYSFTTATLVGGETAIPVDTTLMNSVYVDGLATASSPTTLTLANASWATDLWKNFYVYIPSSGKVRQITGNTVDTLTFSTLTTNPGLVSFQIKQLKFPLTGTVIYNGTTIDYTTIDNSTQLPVVSAVAAPINTPIAIVPESFAAAPRGNRIDTLRGRVYVGRVRNGISLDSAGNTQGSAQAGSEFVSTLLDPTTFTFSDPRLAGEGDILNIPYGGGDIVDTAAFEDQMAIYKSDYIELVQYTEDINDTAIRTPLKPGIGSVARVIRGSDDHFFMTPDKRYTSLSRVRLKDVTPQTENLGLIIKRLLDEYNHTNFNGIEFNNRLISVHRSSDNAENNDVMLVYNKKTKSFEGIWSLPGNFFEKFKSVDSQAAELVYGESNGINVWKMFQTRKADVRDPLTVLPYTALWQSNFFNVLPIKSNIQGICAIAMEGYIRGNTIFTFKMYKDFEDSPSLSFTFGGTEEEFIQGSDVSSFFGAHPFATDSISGSLGDIEDDGRRRFSFIVYFPYMYAQYLSTAFSSSGADQDWEVLRIALGLKENMSTRTSNTKML